MACVMHLLRSGTTVQKGEGRKINDLAFAAPTNAIEQDIE